MGCDAGLLARRALESADTEIKRLGKRYKDLQKHVTAEKVLNQAGVIARQRKAFKKQKEVISRLKNIDLVKIVNELELKCPITHEYFTDPVTTADGHTYERDAIKQWLALGNRTSPNTNARLKTKDLRPNHLVKSIVNTLKDKKLL